MIDFMVWLENFRTPFFDKFYEIVTMMGEETFMLAIMCIVFWCINKKIGYKLGLSIVFNSAVNGAVKDLFKVARPYTKDSRLHPLRVDTTNNTYSLPSGHTQSVTTLWFSLSLSLKKKVFYITALLLSLLIGYSRIYLSVHTPLDVIVAYILAILLTLLCHYIMELCMSKKIYYPMVLLCSPIAIAMIFIQTENYYKLAGLCISFLIGYIIESKYIKFTVKTTLIKQLAKVVLGTIIALGLKIGLKAVFPDQIIFHAIRYLLLGLSVIVISPYLFKKLKLTSKLT